MVLDGSAVKVQVVSRPVDPACIGIAGFPSHPCLNFVIALSHFRLYFEPQFDTAGQERFRVLTKTYYRSANSFVVVFDITSAASFVAIRDWVGEVRAHASADAHLVLVGNKCDSAEAREVTEDEAKELARELGCEYMETSAIGSPDGEEPMEPFRAAARLAVAGLSSEPEPDCNAPVDVSAPRTSAFPCCAI